MITKVCDSKLFVVQKNKTKKASALPVFRSSYPKDDYIADYKEQQRNALRTSFSVVGGALLFIIAYIFMTGIHTNRA